MVMVSSLQPPRLNTIRSISCILLCVFLHSGNMLQQKKTSNLLLTIWFFASGENCAQSLNEMVNSPRYLFSAHILFRLMVQLCDIRIVGSLCVCLQVIVIALSSHILVEGWLLPACVCVCGQTARHLSISACARLSAKPLLLLSGRAVAPTNFDELKPSPRQLNYYWDNRASKIYFDYCCLLKVSNLRASR